MGWHGCRLRKETDMNDKKRYLPCLLMALLFVCMAQVQTAYAASASLSASSDVADVAEGSYVNVSINLNGNPSISTLGMALGYDSSVLSYDSTSWSSSFSGSDMQMASDTGSEVNLSVVCEGSYSADGTVATVRFRAVSDSSSIPVTLSLRDMADADLNAVTDCSVSGRVHVSETAGSGDTVADPGSQETEKEADTADEKNRPAEQQAEVTASAHAGNVQNASGTVTADSQGAEAAAGSRVQQTSVQNAQAAPVSGAAKLDQNYKTGAGIGSDIFLVFAVVCGILALVLAVRKHGEEKK